MSPGLIPRPVASGIAIAVTAVWTMSQVGKLLVPGYEPPTEIHLALMLILGGIFALRRSEAGSEKPESDKAESVDDIKRRLDRGRHGNDR